MAPVKRPHSTLIGVPPPPPTRRPSLPGVAAAVPPPPPARRSQPELPAPRSVHTVSNELALSRTVLASAPEVDVPLELQAAVLVPTARASRPELPNPPLLESPASKAAAPLPAVAPYPAASVERTPAIATAVLDVESAAASPRPGFRPGTAVGVAAIAVVMGLGLTLLVGRALERPGVEAKPVRPSPMAAPSPKGAARPSPVDQPAKAPEIARAAAQTKSAARASEGSPKPTDVPVSSAPAPSCKEILGAGFVERADPEAALAETQLANRELVRGNVDASHASFCKAALLDGTKIERWLNLAQMFLIRRDAEKAVETAERALELDPKNARALEILGDARARLGDLQKARRAYLDAERRAEPNEDTRKWLVRRDLDEAERSARSRDFVRAERLFRRVVVFDPEHAEAALGVAACLRKLGDQRGAEAWERRAETLARARRTGSQK